MKDVTLEVVIYNRDIDMCHELHFRVTVSICVNEQTETKIMQC